MPRIRTLKPEFWQDEKLSTCDPLTRLVFLGLISLADDAGRLVDNLRLIDAQLFMNTSDTAHEALMRLSRMGRIRRGRTASGQRIIEIANWSKHQKIQHANLKAALPEIVELQEDPAIHEALMNASGGAHEPLTHHTNDLRPTTNDQRPTKGGRTARGAATPPEVGGAPPEGMPKPKPAPSDPLFPHFSAEARGRCITAFRKLGAFDPGRIVRAVGPFFRAPDDPAYLPPERVAFAVEDYCGLVHKGRSAPFAGPEDCAKRLGALTRNCITFAHDPISRTDAQLMAIHGSTSLPGAA